MSSNVTRPLNDVVLDSVGGIEFSGLRSSLRFECLRLTCRHCFHFRPSCAIYATSADRVFTRGFNVNFLDPSRNIWLSSLFLHSLSSLYSILFDRMKRVILQIWYFNTISRGNSSADANARQVKALTKSHYDEIALIVHQCHQAPYCHMLHVPQIH